jgi:hypothetical protein
MNASQKLSFMEKFGRTFRGAAVAAALLGSAGASADDKKPKIEDCPQTCDVVTYGNAKVKVWNLTAQNGDLVPVQPGAGYGHYVVSPGQEVSARFVFTGKKLTAQQKQEIQTRGAGKYEVVAFDDLAGIENGTVARLKLKIPKDANGLHQVQIDPLDTMDMSRDYPSAKKENQTGVDCKNVTLNFWVQGKAPEKKEEPGEASWTKNEFSLTGGGDPRKDIGTGSVEAQYVRYLIDNLGLGAFIESGAGLEGVEGVTVDGGKMDRMQFTQFAVGAVLKTRFHLGAFVDLHLPELKLGYETRWANETAQEAATGDLLANQRSGGLLFAAGGDLCAKVYKNEKSDVRVDVCAGAEYRMRFAQPLLDDKADPKMEHGFDVNGQVKVGF